MIKIIKKLRLIDYSKSSKNGRRICNANFGAGFTLIELLVSFVILTTGISVSINLISQSLKSSSYLRNQTIASYLAVEGIETIKNKRDENMLKNVEWIMEIKNACNSAKGCYVDTISDPVNIFIDKCTAAACPPLRYNASRNIYSYFFADPVTIFTRTIRLSGGGDEREITSEVIWRDRFGNHNYTLKTSIFNWK